MSWILEFKTEPAPLEEVAERLARALGRKGVHVFAARSPDWGLELVVGRPNRRKTLLGLGEVEPGVYRAFTKPPSILDHLFGKARLRADVLQALDDALAESDWARDLRWIER
jgi:hypothetical protein